MKNLIYILNVMMILIFASCKDENSFMSVDDEPCYSILISAPGADATRATYKEEGEDLAVVWEKGDVIYVGDYEFVYKGMQGNDALFFHYGEIANAAGWTGTVSYGSTVDLKSQFQKKNNTCGEHLVANVTNIDLTNKPTIPLLPADNMSLLHVRVKAPVMLLGSSMMKVEGLDKSDVYTVTLGNDPSHVFADKDEPIDVYVAMQADKVISGTLKFNFYVYDELLKSAEKGDEYHFYVRCNNVITPVNNEVLKVVLPSKPTHVALQLGLPSGAKWATMNVGATKEEEPGEYYAWGEIEPAPGKNYSESNCVNTWNKNPTTLKNNKVIDSNNNLTPEFDAATQNWGDDWRMPTKVELEELISGCDWGAISGEGYTVKSKKYPNKYIKIPLTGSYEKTEFLDGKTYPTVSGTISEFGRIFLWSSTILTDSNVTIHSYSFDSIYKDGNVYKEKPWVANRARWAGRPIRAVRK